MNGERLKMLRKDRDISQTELADILGVQRAAVSLYETGKNDPSDPIKVTMAKYFDISLDYLLGIVDKPVKPYSEDNFIELPANITEEEKRLIQRFVKYVVYLRTQV